MRAFHAPSSPPARLQSHPPPGSTTPHAWTSYEKTQPFAEAIAHTMKQRYPDRIVAAMAKKLRSGKVFIDWSQNDDHKTTVCVYSMRAKSERPLVAAPVSWEELAEALAGSPSARLILLPALCSRDPWLP